MNDSQASDPPSRPVRVVIADDDDDIRLMLRLAIERRADIELLAAAVNGEQAIDLVSALRPDLLVLDIEMPVLDGLSALPVLREVSPETRVVMLSALDTPAHHARAFAAGAAAYLPKSTPVTSLVDELLGAADLLDSMIDALRPLPSLDVVRGLDGPSRARRFVRDTLADWGDDDVVATVQLLVSELVSNVMVHTTEAPQLSVRLFADIVHIEVFDADPSPPVPRQAEQSATSGRGLAFLEKLSSAWGWTPARQGKVVWFDVVRPDRADLRASGPQGELR